MTDENVVPLPSVLERIATRLKSYLTREASNRAEWIEIQRGICLAMAEARSEISADIAFGQWCDSNGFGKDAINYDTRAAAVEMGKEPEALNKCLQATQRHSLHTICKFDFPKFRNVSKPNRRHVSPKNNLQPQRRKNTTPEAEHAARLVLDEGKTYPEAEEATGLSSTVLRSAIAREEGRRETREAPPLDPAEMAPSVRERYEAALRQAKKQIRAELIDEVRAEIEAEFDIYVKHTKERADRADRIINSHKGLMSRADFRKIKACLHPDHNSFTHAAEALQIFSGLETVLVKPEAPLNVITAPPLPGSVAELLARKAAVAAARRKGKG